MRGLPEPTPQSFCGIACVAYPVAVRLSCRLMEKGPPIWVSDPHGLALPEGETHIQQLWFSSDGVERSAKLTGAVEGDERQVRRR